MLDGSKSSIEISIHALLAESDPGKVKVVEPGLLFLSTLSLRRATVAPLLAVGRARYFYPRSPCGERPCTAETVITLMGFLSTLSLRRATCQALPAELRVFYFYPRSPCGERPCVGMYFQCPCRFLSTLSLRRATARRASRQQPAGISIHALLAESDFFLFSVYSYVVYFYPRSPCGERPAKHTNLTSHISISIHALLAESDVHYDNYNLHCTISIHALLAESDFVVSDFVPPLKLFLSTLSLRRATGQEVK